MRAGKSDTDIYFLSQKKKNGQRNRLISTMWLILLYTVQLIITKYFDFIPNFKILSQAAPKRPLTKNINRQIYKQCDKKGKNNIPAYTWDMIML